MNKKGKVVIKKFDVQIFPRYHQLDVIRKIRNKLKKKGLVTITSSNIPQVQGNPIPLVGYLIPLLHSIKKMGYQTNV